MKRVCSNSEMEYGLLWSNWKNRNDLVWEGSSKPTSTVINRAGSTVVDSQSVHAAPSTSVRSTREKARMRE
ncbi:hypothetical protein LguiA_034932 [Lonicera macranthoides]